MELLLLSLSLSLFLLFLLDELSSAGELLELDEPLLMPEEVSLELEPVEPLIPDEEEPLVPVPLPDRVSEPVDELPVLPEPVLPVPVVLDDPDGLELELLPGDALLPDAPLLLDPLPDEPELLPELEPVWPADMMSSFFTLSVSPEPEKLART